MGVPGIMCMGMEPQQTLRKTRLQERGVSCGAALYSSDRSALRLENAEERGALGVNTAGRSEGPAGAGHEETHSANLISMVDDRPLSVVWTMLFRMLPCRRHSSRIASQAMGNRFGSVPPTTLRFRSRATTRAVVRPACRPGSSIRSSSRSKSSRVNSGKCSAWMGISGQSNSRRTWRGNRPRKSNAVWSRALSDSNPSFESSTVGYFWPHERGGTLPVSSRPRKFRTRRWRS